MSDDDAAILDMLRAARSAVGFVQEIDEAKFKADRMRQLAIERLLEIVGEAAKRVSEECKSAHPSVPWRRAAGLRDFITHEYHRIDLTIVWDIVSRDLPSLISELERLAPSQGN